MIDPELKYCPNCNDEYRAEVESCASCGLVLILGNDRIAMEEARRQKLSSRRGELTPEDDLVAIHKAPLNDIKHIEELLTAERIGTQLAGDDQSCGKGCCPSNYFLLVRREDAEDALAIMHAEYQRMTALEHHDNGHADSVYDDSADEATCPACGHCFATTSTTCPDCGLCFG